MATHPDRSIPGMEIILPDPPKPWAMVVRAEKRQTEWRIHSDRLEDKLDPQGAPTTVLYWGEPYRIEREIQTEGVWMYCMVPWPDDATMFQRFELSNAFIEGRREEVRELKSQHLKLEVAGIYDYLIGFLPARSQVELSQTMGFDPVEATRRSAIVEFFTGFFLLFFGWAAGLPPLATIAIGALAAIDGILRWAWVITDERVNGPLPLEIADWAFERIADKYRDKPREPGAYDD